MSRIDPECFPTATFSDERVCTGCIGDEDLKEFVRAQGGPKGCSFCGRRTAPTAPLVEMAEFIGERMSTFYGRAVDQLPYDGREGGYQGWTQDTEELLFEEIGLELPRDTTGQLARAIVSEIGDDTWTNFDWLRLEIDQGFALDWERFCEAVKHQRRFFFHQIGADDAYDPDARSLWEFLADLGKLVDELGLIKVQPAGYELHRARARKPGVRFTTAKDLGPPPAEFATQSNRMNPPGISMFYGAEKRALACVETRQALLSVGRFIAGRPVRILDLATLAPVPGFFSTASRRERQGYRFLHAFADLICQPVDGDDRTHIDYIPTQVFTEFLRDFPFADGPIDGLRYRSATGTSGANVVLFATQANVCDRLDKVTTIPNEATAWLQLVSIKNIEVG